MVSICIARTEDGLRKGERVLRGVKGEGWRRVRGGEVVCEGGGRVEMLEEEDECRDVAGELGHECGEKVAESGSLEGGREPECASSSGL